MSVRLTKCDCPPIESGVAKTVCRVYVTWSDSPESEIPETGDLLQAFVCASDSSENRFALFGPILSACLALVFVRLATTSNAALLL